MRAKWILAIASVLLSWSTAAAGDPGPWFIATGTWGTYAMSDVNTDVRTVNASLAGTGLSMNEIRNGFGFGFAAGAPVATGLEVGVGYDRLSASSSVGDATGSLEYKLPANAVRAVVEYAFPHQSPFGVHLDLGAGFVTEAGSVAVTALGSGGAQDDVKGHGPLLEGTVGAEVWGSPRFAFTASGGYRYAKVAETKVHDAVVRNDDGTKYAIDYSGFVMRLGIKLVAEK